MADTSLNTPYIVVTGTTLIAIVIIFTVLQPLLGEIRDKRSQVATAQSVLEQKENFLRNLDRKREELQVQRVHEDRLNIILPTNDAYDDALRSITLAADGAGVVIQKVENKSASVQNDINSQRSRGEIVSVPASVTPIAAQIDIVGTYQQLRTLLQNLEKTPRLMDVINIVSAVNPTVPDQVTAKFLLQSYFSTAKP